MLKDFLAGVVLAGVLATGVQSQADEKREFTKDEARFLAHLAAEKQQFETLKALLRIADSDQAPKSGSDLAEYLVGKSVEAVFGAPDVEKGIKGLSEIQRGFAVQKIQAFMNGSLTQIKDFKGKKPSGRNKKFFIMLEKAYVNE